MRIHRDDTTIEVVHVVGYMGENYRETRCREPGEDAQRDSMVRAAPAACPIDRPTTGTYGHSRAARYTGSPAYEQTRPLRKPT